MKSKKREKKFDEEKAIEEMEKLYENMFKKFDRIFEKDFGKMCPEFVPDCVQCEAHLIYNKFKKELWDKMVKC